MRRNIGTRLNGNNQAVAGIAVRAMKIAVLAQTWQPACFFTQFIEQLAIDDDRRVHVIPLLASWALD
jgi:hypothetical protein